MSRLVPAVSPLSHHDIERQSIAIIKEFCPAHLSRPGEFPVLDFFEWLRDARQLDVGVEDLPPNDEGITYPDGRVILSESTYRGMVAGNPRDRFTAIHEGYHGLQHARQLQHRLVHSKLVLHRRQSIPTFRDPEWQANAFASVTLMPTEMVREVVRSVREWYRPIILQNTFRVSAQSATFRLKHLVERNKI